MSPDKLKQPQTVGGKYRQMGKRNWTRRPTVQELLSSFPLHTYRQYLLHAKPIHTRRPVYGSFLHTRPTASSPPTSSASNGEPTWLYEEHLKEQSNPPYLDHIAVRTDVHPQGSIDGQLPSLWDGAQLLVARELPAWVDSKVSIDNDGGLEGYKDEAARDESRAWVALLEGCVHAALLAVQPMSAPFSLAETKSRPIGSVLAPPLAPLSSLTSLFPAFGTRIPREAIQLRYREAIRI